MRWSEPDADLRSRLSTLVGAFIEPRLAMACDHASRCANRDARPDYPASLSSGVPAGDRARVCFMPVGTRRAAIGGDRFDQTISHRVSRPADSCRAAGVPRRNLDALVPLFSFMGA